MAVDTHNVTLSNFGKDHLPISFADPMRDQELLVPKVVKFEDDRICLPTVSARMFGEVFEDESGPLGQSLLGVGCRAVDVALPILQVVLSLICLPACFAEVVAAPLRSDPFEFRFVFDRAAAAALLAHQNKV